MPMIAVTHPDGQSARTIQIGEPTNPTKGTDVQYMMLGERHGFIRPIDRDDELLFKHCAPGVQDSPSYGIECRPGFYASTVRPLLLAHGITPIIKQ